MATLYHPTLKRTIVVPDTSVSVYEKSGWTADVPKKYLDEAPGNNPSPETLNEEEASG